ncbi:unnamed protein product [Ectocarpus sp. 12 AP-2014]
MKIIQPSKTRPIPSNTQHSAINQNRPTDRITPTITTELLCTRKDRRCDRGQTTRAEGNEHSAAHVERTPQITTRKFQRRLSLHARQGCTSHEPAATLTSLFPLARIRHHYLPLSMAALAPEVFIAEAAGSAEANPSNPSPSERRGRFSPLLAPSGDAPLTTPPPPCVGILTDK